MAESKLVQRLAEVFGISDEEEPTEPTGYLDGVDGLRENLRKALETDDPRSSIETVLGDFRSEVDFDHLDEAREELSKESDTLEADMDAAELDRKIDEKVSGLEGRLEKQETAINELTGDDGQLAQIAKSVEKLGEAKGKEEEKEQTTEEKVDALHGDVTELVKSVNEVVERVNGLAEGGSDQPEGGEPVAKSALKPEDAVLASIL